MTMREVAKERRNEFVRTVGSGKSISVAREKGYELISEDRLGDLLADLQNEGLINPDRVLTQDEILAVAKRGIEILRG